MKKILALISLLLSVMLFLSACTVPDTPTPGSSQSDNGSDTPSGNSSDSDPIPPDGQVTIVNAGSTEYTVIKPQRCTSLLTNSLLTLRKMFGSTCGVDTNKSLMPSDDWVQGLGKDEAYESDAKEILIGATNRKETQDILAQLEEGEYAVSVTTTKIVLVGKNEYLSTLAVSLFINTFLRNINDGTLKITPGTFLKDKSEVATLGDTDATVRIMTFNILGSSDSPDTRYPYILKTIQTYNPGIVSFQECNANCHNKIIANLAGYASAHTTHSGKNTKVYTPIVYRTDLYKVVKSGQEWLDMRYTATNTKSLAWAVFEEISSGKKFAVVNMHGALWTSSYPLPEGKTYDQMRAEAVQWRVDNVRQMNDRMKAILAEFPDIPCLWTGDFNFTKDSDAYKAVIGYGMKDAEFSATEKHDTGTKTTHPVGSAPDAGNSIDHVFGNGKITFRVHKICNTADDLKGSDHCPVYADVKFES